MENQRLERHTVRHSFCLLNPSFSCANSSVNIIVFFCVTNLPGVDPSSVAISSFPILPTAATSTNDIPSQLDIFSLPPASGCRSAHQKSTLKQTSCHHPPQSIERRPNGAQRYPCVPRRPRPHCWSWVSGLVYASWLRGLHPCMLHL